jgi:hypothetical protein
MARFLIVYRGAPGGSSDAPGQNLYRWDAWFHALGPAVLDRGCLTHSSVEVPSRLLGPKLSSSSLSGYSVIEADDFDAAVKLAEECPIFDEHGSVEIARLSGGEKPAG